MAGKPYDRPQTSEGKTSSSGGTPHKMIIGDIMWDIGRALGSLSVEYHDSDAAGLECENQKSGLARKEPWHYRFSLLFLAYFNFWVPVLVA